MPLIFSYIESTKIHKELNVCVVIYIVAISQNVKIRNTLKVDT